MTRHPAARAFPVAKPAPFPACADGLWSGRVCRYSRDAGLCRHPDTVPVGFKPGENTERDPVYGWGSPKRTVRR